MHQDTRVMNIHRLFYTAGVKFKPELNLKIATNQTLTEEETKLVNSVAQTAGLGKLVKDGHVKFPDGTISSTKNSQSEKYQLDIDAANKGIAKVNQDFKPIKIEVKVDEPKKNKIEHKSEPTHNINKPKPTANTNTGCMSFSCVGRR